MTSEPLEVRVGDVVRLKSRGPPTTAERKILAQFIKLDALEPAGLEEETPRK